MVNPAWMVQLGQAAQGLIARQQSGAGDLVVDAAKRARALQARQDPMGMGKRAAGIRPYHSWQQDDDERMR